MGGAAHRSVSIIVCPMPPSVDGPADLGNLRAEIDRVDDQILALLDRRAEVVREVGRRKREHRQTFHVPGRERAVLERLTAAANGAFPREAVRPVFREIMSACLSLESPLRVSFPGPEATFSHLAGRTRFGLSAVYEPAATLGEVFREVGRGADYGVVPVEEASEGLVTHALDYFLDSDLLIVGEIVIEASHALLTHSGSTPASSGYLRTRWRQPVARRGWWRRWGARPSWRRPRPRPRRPWPATISGRRRWRPHWPPSSSTSTWRGPGSTTVRPRWLAFSCSAAIPAPPTGRDATSLLLGLDDRPGRLAEVLARLSAAGVNLRRIASRPTDRRGLHDLFFVDLDGHREEPACRSAVAALAGDLPLMKVLGSYPRDRADGASS